MDRKMMIKDITKLMEETCKLERNFYTYDIWKYHIVDVIKYAKLLAQKLNADEEIVEIAAILHDFASVKEYSLQENHHIHGAKEAERILKSYNYPDDRITKVKECIVQHRGSVRIEYTSVEAACVASADAMAHIHHFVSLLKLAYQVKGLGVSEGAIWVNEKITRSWNKLMPEAKEVIEKKYFNVKDILDIYR